MRTFILSLCIGLITVTGAALAAPSPHRETLHSLEQAVRLYVSTDALHDQFLLTDDETHRLRKLSLIDIPHERIRVFDNGESIVAANFHDTNGDRVEVYFHLDKGKNVARVRIHSINNVVQEND